MYETILQLFAGLINVVGTIYAILSILKLSPKQIFEAITIKGMNAQDENLLEQKAQARIGISLVAFGWLLQVMYALLEIITLCAFSVVFGISIVLAIGLCIILHCVNKKFEQEYRQLKETQEDETHLDGHTWKEF